MLLKSFQGSKQAFTKEGESCWLGTAAQPGCSMHRHARSLTFLFTNSGAPALPPGAAAGLLLLLLSLLLLGLGELARGHVLTGRLVGFCDLLLVQSQGVGRHLRLRASTLQHPLGETFGNLQSSKDW